MPRFSPGVLSILLVLAVTASSCSPAAVQPPVAAPDAPADTDTPAVAAVGPAEATSSGAKQTIGSDPVSGRNRQVDFAWEEYCYSSEYQLQIAKDPEFTLIVLDTGAFAPASSMSAAAYFPAGGLAASPSSLSGWARLEAGHTYYWRVRVRRAATGQYLRSPWSEMKSFTIEP